MVLKPLPFKLQEFARALEGAASDVFPFAVVCLDGFEAMAEPILQDLLLLGLEQNWFTEDFQSNFSHFEFREEFFRQIWLICKDKKTKVQVGVDVPLGHEEMRFYQLDLLSRAALYLRTRRKFSYATIANILQSDPLQLRALVEKARTQLLGREPRALAVEEF